MHQLIPSTKNPVPRSGHCGAECQLSPARNLQQLTPNDGIWEGAGQVSSAMFQACSEQSPEAGEEGNGKEIRRREGQGSVLVGPAQIW